jgi:hypothetical protein
MVYVGNFYFCHTEYIDLISIRLSGSFGSLFQEKSDWLSRVFASFVCVSRCFLNVFTLFGLCTSQCCVQEFVPVQSLYLYGWRRGTAPLILNFGTRWWWVVNFTPGPLYPWPRTLWYPLSRTLGSHQSRSGRFGGEKYIPCAITVIINIVCYWRNNPPGGQGFLIHEVSRAHTTAHHNR